jgi:hypothetical protein
MSILQRLGLAGHTAKEASLVERIKVLEAALAERSAVVGSIRSRRGFAIALATVIFVFGFLLGIYTRPVMEATVDRVVALGRSGAVSHADAVNAAYQKGDYETTLRLLRPLAEQGDAHAQLAVGEIYYHGRGVPHDDAEAMKWFLRAGEQGDASAQFHLGEMHAQGQSVPKDYVEAAKWYRLAAEQGYGQAQYNLGLAYTKGEGVSQDNVRAYMWFNLAAGRFALSDSSSRNAAITNRDLIAKTMTAAEIAEAQKLAREWKSKQ